MTEKQNNKNKEYNKVIDAMKTIQNFCNSIPSCNDCPFSKIGTCDLRNSTMGGVPMSWTIPRKRKVVQTQADDPRINPFYGSLLEDKND